MAFFEDKNKKNILIDLDVPFNAEKCQVPQQKEAKRPFKQAIGLFLSGFIFALILFFIISIMPEETNFNIPSEILTLASFITAIALGILINKARMFHENSMSSYQQLIAANDMLLSIISTVEDKNIRDRIVDTLKYLIYSIFLSILKFPFRIKSGKELTGESIYNPILTRLIQESKKAGIDKEIGWSSAGLIRLTTARAALLTNIRFEIRPAFYITSLFFFFLSHLLITLKILSSGFDPWLTAALMGALSYGFGVFIYLARNESHPNELGSGDMDLNRRYLRFINKVESVDEMLE